MVSLRAAAAALCAGVLTLAASPVSAGFTLREGGVVGEKDGRFTASLGFQTRPKPAHVDERRLRIPEGEEFDGLRALSTDGYVRAEGPVNWAAESVLLAVPAARPLDLSQWRVTARVVRFADGSPVFGATVPAAAVTLKPATVGTVGGVQVVVDPTQALDGAGTRRLAAELVIDMDGAYAALPDLPVIEAATGGEAAGILQSTFLNGGELRVIPARSMAAHERIVAKGSAPTAPPEPPGAFRVSYRTGNQILRVSLASLGITAGQVGTVRIDYQTSALPIGGVIGSDLWFYAPKQETLTNVNDAVFITADSPDPSPMMATRPALVTLATSTTTVAIQRDLVIERNAIYESSAPAPVGQRFFFWRASSGGSRSVGAFTIFDTITSTDMRLAARVWGYNQSAVAPDHFMDMTVSQTTAPTASVLLPRFSFDGRTLAQPVWNFSLPALPPSLAQFNITHAVPSGSPFDGIGADSQNLDLLTLTYTGIPRLDASGRCVVAVPASGSPTRVTVGRLSGAETASGFLILDVTDFERPQQVTGAVAFNASGDRFLEWESDGVARRYLVARITGLAASVNAVAAEALPPYTDGTTSLEGIVVRDPSLDSAIDPILTLRGGPSGWIKLDPQAAYNAYSFGMESPGAIQAAMQDYLANAPLRNPLPTVLLVGHGSVDRKNFVGNNQGPQIPPFVEESVPVSTGNIENPIDHPYGTLEGNDEFVDVLLGRIPARTTTEVGTVATRLQAYEAIKSTLENQDRGLLSVVDNDPEFLFDSSYWLSIWNRSLLPSSGIDIAIGSNGSSERAAIASALTTGNGLNFLIYTGHGNTDRWAAENIWRTTDIPTADTTGKWPIVMTFTCLNGYYARTITTPAYTLSEAWLFGTPFGAVANVAPVSVDYYSEQRLMLEMSLYLLGEPVASRPSTVGGLFHRMINRYTLAYPFFAKTAREYILFGDPLTPTTQGIVPGAAVDDWTAR